MPLVQEIIRKKRDQLELDAADVDAIVAAIADGAASDAQLAAFAMAVFLNGMSRAETVALTGAMASSGQRLDWTEAGGPILDKHSTGGVGDKVSLILAPLLAACGASVPMVSGRGLGHTGGTLDKLEAIPGYRTNPQLVDLQRVVRTVGCAIVGAGPDIAPADQRLYAVRDVTATVESAALVVSSILAKKLAAGLDGLVLDVKCGTGGYSAEPARVQSLARDLVEVARAAGLPATALISDMNRVLGSTAGNALELREAIDFLNGGVVEPRLLELTLRLGEEALLLGSIASVRAEARALLTKAIAGGHGLERFAAMAAGLGGPVDLVERLDTYLPCAPVELAVAPVCSGTVAAIDVRALGMAVVALGGGRRRSADAIDPRVGLSRVAGPGQHVGTEQPLALVHAANEADAWQACEAVQAAFEVVQGADCVAAELSSDLIIGCVV